jgi:hypothetical protein
MGFETKTVDGSGCCDTQKKMLGCLLTGSDKQELVFKPNIIYYGIDTQKRVIIQYSET